jgi:hypothetical protein
MPEFVLSIRTTTPALSLLDEYSQSYFIWLCYTKLLLPIIPDFSLTSLFTSGCLKIQLKSYKPFGLFYHFSKISHVRLSAVSVKCLIKPNSERQINKFLSFFFLNMNK